MTTNPQGQSWQKGVLIGTAVVAAGVGLYLYSRRNKETASRPPEKPRIGSGAAPDVNSGLTGKSAEELKQIGNALFTAKDYTNAVIAFTKALEAPDANDALKSVLYQNRAAAKEYLGNSATDIIADCDAAIGLNRHYAKAYVRRAKNAEKTEDWNRVIVDLMAAMHLDEKLQELSSVKEQAQRAVAQLESTIIPFSAGNHAVPISQDTVRAWLSKTVLYDTIRNDVVSGVSSHVPPSKYEKALQLVRDDDFDTVADVALEEQGSDRPKALLLAARFLGYGNRHEEKKNALEEAKTLINASDDEETQKKLTHCVHSVFIDTAHSKSEFLEAFETAKAFDAKNEDFYVQTAFRMMQGEGFGGGMVRIRGIVTDENVSKENHNAQLLRYAVEIMALMEQGDMAEIHSKILALEKYVTDRPSNSVDAYGNVVLAKMYSLMGNDDLAIPLLDDAIQAEPRVASHYFDRSCFGSSEQETKEYLKKCLDIDKYNVFAHVTSIALFMKDHQNKLPNRVEWEDFERMLDVARKTADGSFAKPDISALGGVLRQFELKKQAAEMLGVF